MIDKWYIGETVMLTINWIKCKLCKLWAGLGGGDHPLLMKLTPRDMGHSFGWSSADASGYSIYDINMKQNDPVIQHHVWGPSPSKENDYF